MDLCIDTFMILALFLIFLIIVVFLFLAFVDGTFDYFSIFIIGILFFLLCSGFLAHAQEVPIENEVLDSSTEVTVPEADSLEEYKIDLMNEYLKDIRDSLVATSSDVQPLTD